MNLDLAKILDRRLGGFLGGLLGAADRWRAAMGGPPRPVRVRRILVVKFWGLGNWALLRPVVRDVAARWPGARLVVATLAANRPLVADLADEVLTVRATSFASAGRDLARALARLRADPCDLALDFEQFSRTGGLLARLAGVPQRIGFASGEGGRDGLYTVRVPFRLDAHVSRSFRDLAEAAGVDPAPYVPGALAPTPAGRAAVERLDLPAPYVVLHPGSGDNFPGRRWSRAGFAAVARQAAARGHAALVTGAPGEAGLAGAVAREAGAPARSLAGALDLEGLVALLAGARALVANDTGPVHLASALGVPTLAIYGPNTPVLYGPLAPGSRAFYRALPCSPCLTTSNYRSSACRIPVCTAGVPTGAVTTALADLLAEVIA